MYSALFPFQAEASVLWSKYHHVLIIYWKCYDETEPVAHSATLSTIWLSRIDKLDHGHIQTFWTQWNIQDSVEHRASFGRVVWTRWITYWGFPTRMLLSQACYIVEIYHSGPEPSIYSIKPTVNSGTYRTKPVNFPFQTLNIFSLQASPAAADTLTVLLLHGLGDSSRTWQEVNTLHLLAAWGFKAVAIDLPGS